MRTSFMKCPSLRDEIPTLNYYVTPVVVIVIGTYFVAHSFMGKSVRLLLLQ